MSVPYRDLLGGYLEPRWSARKYEGWRAAYSVVEDVMPGHVAHAGGSGTVTLAQTPVLQGDFSVKVAAYGPPYGDGIAVSTLAMDLSGYQGIGLGTYVVDTATLDHVRVRLYTTWGPTPAYYEVLLQLTGPQGASAAAYGGALYGVGRYTAAPDSSAQAWQEFVIPWAAFTTVGSPSLAAINRVELAVVVAGGYAEVWFDAVSGWVELMAEDRAANRMMSNLPEYHWDQPFNDALLQDVGYELDGVRGSLEHGLDQRLASLASWGLAAHEREMNLPVEPALWPEVRRRALVKLLQQQPATHAELVAGLTAVCGATVTLTEAFSSQRVDASVALYDPLAEAMLQLALERLLPAHLTWTVSYPLAARPVGSGSLVGDLRLTARLAAACAGAGSLTGHLT